MVTEQMRLQLVVLAVEELAQQRVLELQEHQDKEILVELVGRILVVEVVGHLKQGQMVILLLLRAVTALLHPYRVHQSLTLEVVVEQEMRQEQAVLEVVEQAGTMMAQLLRLLAQSTLVAVVAVVEAL